MTENAAKLLIPIAGLAVCGSISGATTYGLLRESLSGHEKIATACVQVIVANEILLNVVFLQVMNQH